MVKLAGSIAIILAFVTLAWVVTHVYTAKDEHATPVFWRGRHRRTLIGGPYLIWPGERIGPPIDMREHEVRYSVPDVYIHGGFPVTLDLCCTLRLSPTGMSQEELHLEPDKRKAKHTESFRGCLQQAILEVPPLIAQEDPERISLAAIFSPLLGDSFSSLLREFQESARRRLAEHGAVLIVNTLVVESVKLPPVFVDAYQQFCRHSFDTTAGFAFMDRIQAAAPKISGTCLMQLSNAVNRGPGWVRDIFANGSFSPTAYTGIAAAMIVSVPTPASPQPVGSPGAPIPEVKTADAFERNYPLTTEGMAMLRALQN